MEKTILLVLIICVYEAQGHFDSRDGKEAVQSNAEHILIAMVIHCTCFFSDFRFTQIYVL